MSIDTADTWKAGYDMGRRHGYDLAAATLLRILRERNKAGEDILALLPLVDDLRERQDSALNEG